MRSIGGMDTDLIAFIHKDKIHKQPRGSPGAVRKGMDVHEPLDVLLYHG
jgi:hypothetical protein